MTYFKRKILPAIFTVGLSCLLPQVKAVQPSKLNIEEARVAKITTINQQLTQTLSFIVDDFKHKINQVNNYTAMMQMILRYGQVLWRNAIKQANESQSYDDRPLYWARLQMRIAVKKAPLFSSLLADQQQKLLWQFELLSRGSQDIRFKSNADTKILLTGFDPFYLDNNINQSNPSGVTALALDGAGFNVSGKRVEIQTVILPVRFADFDQGMVETILTPWLRKNVLDMLVTTSMGRDQFDLEHFPALRRSAKAPDNLNVYTGASKQHPLKPKLNGKPLSGNEFLQFSLPYQQMMQAHGGWQIRDNRMVTTTDGQFYADSLMQLLGKTSVAGSGGGYLSNEVSYRSLRLRDQYQPLLPTGHIHTPRVKQFDKATNKAIVEQILAMLRKAIEGN